MMSDEPLHVQVARAVGWKYVGEGEAGWEGEPPLGHVLDKLPRRLDQHVGIPPYGSDTPDGWACTGPLIGEYRIELEVRTSGWQAVGYSHGVERGATAAEAIARLVVELARRSMLVKVAK